jgi:hypothetical protein
LAWTLGIAIAAAVGGALLAVVAPLGATVGSAVAAATLSVRAAVAAPRLAPRSRAPRPLTCWSSSVLVLAIAGDPRQIAAIRGIATTRKVIRDPSGALATRQWHN